MNPAMTMQTIPLDRVAELLAGHVGLLSEANGLQPIRLPPNERHLYDDFTRLTASMSAGIRLRLVTETRRLRLTTSQRQSFLTKPGQWSPSYDLFIDGTFHRRVAAEGGVQFGAGTQLPGDPQAVLDLQDLPAAHKQIELWFPATALVAISALEIDAGSFWRPWPDERPRIVFHGSSITHGIEADGASDAWPAVAARLSGAQLLNLGWAGSCLMSGLAGRLIRDQAADIIVLELGVNVHQDGLLKERSFLSSLHALLAIIRDGHPETTIIVLSPFYKPDAEETAQGEGLTLVQMRALIEQVVNVRRQGGDGHILYLSGLELFSADDRDDLPDGSHPNTAGHLRIGRRFFEAALKGRL